ncbi:MAG: hypothetical protein ABL982_08495, partial [Vicinamibacterales bacterium]
MTSIPPAASPAVPATARSPVFRTSASTLTLAMALVIVIVIVIVVMFELFRTVVQTRARRVDRLNGLDLG